MNDVRFIAHARSDVPSLLAYIEHLEAQLPPERVPEVGDNVQIPLYIDVGHAANVGYITSFDRRDKECPKANVSILVMLPRPSINIVFNPNLADLEWDAEKKSWRSRC